MKVPVFAALLVAAALPLAACETSGTAQADRSDTQNVAVSTNGVNENVAVPAGASDNQQPYAVRGNGEANSNAPDRYARQGSNGW